MSGTDDLKDLLDRLKDEVGPLPEPAERASRAAPPPEHRPQPGVMGRFQRPRPELPRELPRDNGAAGPVWSENKEAMLFGVLASIIMAFGGILAGLDYLVLAGTVFFMLFALVMFLSLFGTYLNSRRRAAGPDPALNARVEALARKVEALGSRPPAPGPLVQGPGHDRELEAKVEELRVLVKSLSRAVEHNGK